ncbi:MAG: DUF721 domain-containing protein [Bdellovibrionales bacterium]
MRPLSESTARVSGQCFQRKYIALGRIVKHWPQIIGESLADKAQPVKIHYRKMPKGQSPDVRLDIATTNAHATVLRNQVGIILERMNQIFGERWITAIRFVNAPVNVSVKKPKRRPLPLTHAQKKTLSETLSHIDDEDMQIRLNSLGEAILTENQS